MKAMKTYGLIATLAMAAICTSAFAQGGPPPPRGGGQPDMQGGPQGGPGMGLRMGPHEAPLLMRPDVQKELKLTEEQIEKIKGLFPPPMGGPHEGMAPGGGQGFGGPGGQPGRQGGAQAGQRRGGGQPGQPPQGGPGGGPDGPQMMRMDMDDKLKDVLSDSQLKRLKELRLQRQGAEALSRKEIAEKAGLSDEHRQLIRGILEEARENAPHPQPGERPDPQEMKKQMDAFRADLNKKVLAVLSSTERSKWEAMLGKPFKFDENWHPEPPRGGPEGGPGGFGGGPRGPGGGDEFAFWEQAADDMLLMAFSD